MRLGYSSLGRRPSQRARAEERAWPVRLHAPAVARTSERRLGPLRPRAGPLRGRPLVVGTGAAVCSSRHERTAPLADQAGRAPSISSEYKYKHSGRSVIDYRHYSINDPFYLPTILPVPHTHMRAHIHTDRHSEREHKPAARGFIRLDPNCLSILLPQTYASSITVKSEVTGQHVRWAGHAQGSVGPSRMSNFPKMIRLHGTLERTRAGSNKSCHVMSLNTFRPRYANY